MKLDREQRIFFRNEFRDARALALKDAEGYQQILFVLEKFGSLLTRKHSSLGSYSRAIIRFVEDNLAFAKDMPNNCQEWHMGIKSLCDHVREARNEALHQGAVARHLTSHAVKLSLLVEDALMSNANQIKDYMVRNPVCAESWQPISFIRQMMLENSFSYLPVKIEKRWYTVSDFDLAKYMNENPTEERNDRLAKHLEDAVEAKEIELRVAATAHPNERMDVALNLFMTQMNSQQPV